MAKQPTPESIFSIVNEYIVDEQKVDSNAIDTALEKINNLGELRFELVAQSLRGTADGHKVRRLLELGAERTLPYIRHALYSNNSSSRQQAFNVAKTRGDLDVLKDVFLSHTDDNLRKNAADALVQNSREGVNIVEGGLESQDSKTRIAAAKAMNKFINGNENISVSFREKILAKFSGLLNDSEAQIRRNAFQALHNSGRLTHEIISDFIQDDDADNRFRAFRALLQMGVDETNASLFSFVIEDSDGNPD